MSGFLALVDPSRQLLAESSLAPVLATLMSRGDRCEVWRNGHVLLAVTRFEWELADGYSGPTLVTHDGEISVVADATLYYRDDLVRELATAGVRPVALTPAHLIAAAYRAWGADCVHHLEGDYAFVVHDHARGETFAARDFMGRRPVYYAEFQGALVIASMAKAIVAHPSWSRELDDVALAEIVSVGSTADGRTPFTAVRELPAATSLRRVGSTAVQRTQYWAPVTDEREDRQSFDDAADHLRELIGSAIVERRAPSGPTTIWLSGGYDSPVMYAAGNAALDRVGFDRLSPISFSYPVGDPGREDELIDEILGFWDARTTWLSIGDVPLLAHAFDHAARSDIPFQHAFENWLRALLGATARQRSRVALYGDGGDQLFAVSTIFLRDLFSGLQWRDLLREWRAFEGTGARALWNTVAVPVLRHQARRHLGLRGTPASFPVWIDREFVARRALDRREADAQARLESGIGGYAATETRRALTDPILARVLAGLSALALEHGIELRAPLLDRRVVEFALRRPRAERASNGAVKYLLRRSARELLPASVLAPRPHKTGVLTGYFARSFRADPGGLVSDVFASSILVRRGIIDGQALQKVWHEYKQSGRGGGGHLFVTFQVELWLDALKDGGAASPRFAREQMNTPAAGFVQ